MCGKFEYDQYTSRGLALVGVLFFGSFSVVYSGIVELTDPFVLLALITFGGIFVYLAANAVYLALKTDGKESGDSSP